MDNSWLKEIHFERCPKCGAIVLFKKDSDASKRPPHQFEAAFFNNFFS